MAVQETASEPEAAVSTASPLTWASRAVRWTDAVRMPTPSSTGYWEDVPKSHGSSLPVTPSTFASQVAKMPVLSMGVLRAVVVLAVPRSSAGFVPVWRVESQ